MSDAEARRVERALEEVAAEADTPMVVDPHPDRTRTFATPSFLRMRTRWTEDEREVIAAANTQLEEEIDAVFGDAYRILARLYDIVREPWVDPVTGEVRTNALGRTLWRKDADGGYLEDWSRLTDRDKETFLHQITTRLVLWGQQTASIWGEAMFAKAMWEERFALSFTEDPEDGGRRPTVDDRTQRAQVGSREQRYLAVYMAIRSKRADRLVSDMERLALRLRDTSQ